MEVNKDEAERCKVIGANAMKQKQYERAAKFFRKSLSLYPLPGVEALLSTAERMVQSSTDDDNETSNNNNTSSSSSTNENDGNTTNTNNRYARSASTASTASSTTTNPSATAGTSSSGRTYTQAHVEIVEKILTAKANGGRTAHYKVLGISATACTESDIKKAYRKLAIKVHSDKNWAPKADEAFKAVGLAYATLSDPQKKAIYDRYGDEDPDNRGGGSGGMRHHHRGPGGMHFRPGDEVSPEDIFNMFFGGMAGGPGGGMHRGPGGMHFYSTFGGPAGGFARAAQQQRQRQQQQRGAAGPAQDDPGPGLGNLIQLLPFLLIMALSFMNMTESGTKTATSHSVGENRYFSLTVSVSAVCARTS